MRNPAIGLALLLSLVVGTAAAQTCRDNIRASAADSRFSDNGNGTVTDLATNLIWKQCAEGLSGIGCTTGVPATFTWQQALQYAADAEFTGSSFWRLPNKNELASLIERRCYNPAVNAQFFPNTPFTGWFWSSSPYPDGFPLAWNIDFKRGYVMVTNTVNPQYVRLVRGGQ